MEADVPRDPVGQLPKASQIRDVIRTFVGGLLECDVDSIDTDVSLLKLGAQSLHFIVLASHLEKQYHIEVPREYAIPDDYSVDTFVAVVKRELSRRAVGEASDPA